ncbi:unnamed protein product [Symbiodinium natans]|uniref:Uncharacterized protein n=1 Tax=Symbiodinium natans TaxID=878477 RepID=A0A812PG34_9DINO|nr:unnamed protein product [Symbiodinium natans]
MLMASKHVFCIGLMLLHCVKLIHGVRKADIFEGEVAQSSTANADAHSSRITVRETETPLISIHQPMDPEDMQKMLGDHLVPDVYDGKAFIQVSVFDLSKLEIAGFLPSFMSSWCLRVSAYVKMKDSGEKGYMILSADFEDTISGMFMTRGCKSSQLGTLCGTIAVKHTDEGDSKMFTVSEGGEPILHFAAQLGGVSNTAFFNWANERYVRFRLSDDKKTLLRGEQEDKTWDGNHQVQTDAFHSAIFNTKFAKYQWGYLDEVTDACRKGYCFFSEKAGFVDHEAKPVAEVGRQL